MATKSDNPVKGHNRQAPRPCSGTRRKRKLRLFYLNFFWIVLIGVSVLWFIGRYTDWFEVIGGFLGLGGICAWWAFSLDLIRDKNKKRLQLAFEKRLRSRSSAFVLAGISAGLICLAANVRCIIIDASRDTTDRTITIWDEDQEVVREGLLSSRGTMTIPFFVMAARKDYVLDVEGLPTRAVSVRRLQRVSIETPHDCLLKNAILVRPSVQLSGTAQNKELEFRMHVVRYGNKGSPSIKFTGQSVWLGTHKRLEIPKSVEIQWRLDLTGHPKPGVIDLLWFHPEPCPMASSKAFKANERIDVEIRKGDGTLFCGKTVYVIDCDHPDKFPQIVYLNHTDKPDD